MTRYDFVYITSYNECDVQLIAGLQRAFGRMNKSFAVIGYVSTYVENLHRAAGVPFFNLRAPGSLHSLSRSEWGALERELGTTLAEFVFPEQRYYMTDLPKLAARTRAILDGFACLFEHISIGSMVHKLGAELIRRSAILEAKRRGIRTVILGTFPAHFKGRMFLHNQIWSERDNEHPPAANQDDEVSLEEFRRVLARIRDRSEVIHYPLAGMRRWREVTALVGSMVAKGETEFVGDFVSRRLEMIRFRARNAIGNLVAKESLPEEPYYFFPLHVFDDSQITVRNPEFYDQTWVIEYIDRVLPVGMKLVVKLHPGLDGAVPWTFLKALRRLDRVHLLKGSVNAHKVIESSQGVIVINSTVAFEALLHRKPVLVLGRWSFGRLGMTSHIEDPRELPAALLRLRDEPFATEQVDRILYDLYGEMRRCSYNREPIDYDSLASAMIDYVGAGA